MTEKAAAAREAAREKAARAAEYAKTSAASIKQAHDDGTLNEKAQEKAAKASSMLKGVGNSLFNRVNNMME